MGSLGEGKYTLQAILLAVLFAPHLSAESEDRLCHTGMRLTRMAMAQMVYPQLSEGFHVFRPNMEM